MQFTITKTQSTLCHLLSLCIALTMFQACDVDDVVGLNYDEVQQYGSFFGDPNHSTVIVHSQGSNPTTKLLDSKLITLLSPVRTNNMIIANVGQRQVGDTRVINLSNLTPAQAEAMNNQSVDDLATVIRHFKGQGKTVYVFGSGFGGYLTQELISRYGTEIADKYLIMGSRLKIESEFVDSWMDGKSVQYDHNSTPAGVISSDVTSSRDANLNRLFGAISKDNYLEKLQGQDLSQLTYVYTAKDEVVGVIDNVESTFLTTNNANIIIAEGDHNSGLQETIVRSMKEGFGIE